MKFLTIKDHSLISKPQSITPTIVSNGLILKKKCMRNMSNNNWKQNILNLNNQELFLSQQEFVLLTLKR